MVTLIGEGNYTAVTDFDRQDNKTYAEIHDFESGKKIAKISYNNALTRVSVAMAVIQVLNAYEKGKRKNGVDIIFLYTDDDEEDEE